MINQEKLAEFIANPPDEYLREACASVGAYCLDVDASKDEIIALIDAELIKIYTRLVEQKQIDDHLANEWLGE